MRNTLSKFIWLTVLASTVVGCGATLKSPKAFQTPDDALKALEVAVAERSKNKAIELFGEDGDYLLHSGDPVLDQERANKFVELFNQGHRLKPGSDGSYILVIGKKDWPFPVPLYSGEKGWYFGAEAGREIILARTIGRNELSALSTANTIYMAQRNYSAKDRDGDGLREYASHIVSTPGQRDGLYWPVNEGEEVSPLGPGIAKAADENYTISSGGEPQPYKGYLHKIIYSPANLSTSSDVLSKPGSYWLISYPALWGSSGIMTFASNERGWIYEKNLAQDDSILKASTFKIDDTWSRVE